MKRTVIGIGLFALVAGAAGAAAYAGKLSFLGFGGDPEPVSLVPDGAEAIFGVSVPALLQMEAYSEGLVEEMRKQPDYPQMMEVMRLASECGFELDDLDRVTGGFNAEKNLVFVVTGHQIGSEQQARCFADKARALRPGDTSMDPVERNGRIAWVIEDPEEGQTMFGYRVSDDMVVIVDSVWEPLVLSLLDGNGVAAKDGRLREAYAATNPEQDLWIAGSPPKELSDQMESGGLEFLVADMRLHDGFELNMIAEMVDAAKARELLERVKPQIHMAKAGLIAMGIPSGVIDRASMEVSGGKITARVDVTPEEMTELERAINEISRLATENRATAQPDSNGLQERSNPGASLDWATDRPIPAFVFPREGECASSYRLVDGVCVHLAYTRGAALAQEIERFKRGGVPPTLGGGKKDSMPFGNASSVASTSTPPTMPPVQATADFEHSQAAGHFEDQPLDPGALRGSSTNQFDAEAREPVSRGASTARARKTRQHDGRQSAQARAHCEQAKATLAKYEREGVPGVNPVTGKVQRMPPTQAAEQIRMKRDEVEILCDGAY